MSIGPIPSPGSEHWDAAKLASQYGLQRAGARPSLGRYLAQLARRRHFIWTLASSRTYNQNQNNYLGQIWAVLNPLMLAVVYYLVFGVLLGTRDGVDNFVAFLVIGIFIYQSFAATITAGSTAISGNLAMVRALRFPRASLPISVSLSELLSLLPALVVMLVIVVVTGEPITWTWLLTPLAVLLALLFNTGCALIAARIVVMARDLRNLIPVATRLLRYVSGVFYSIAHYTGDSIGGYVMEYQPIAVYLNLVRSCVMEEFEVRGATWLAGGIWAVVLLGLGFVVFWQAEERYGRD